VVHVFVTIATASTRLTSLHACDDRVQPIARSISLWSGALNACDSSIDTVLRVRRR
jgi:hypothetical protein